MRVALLILLLVASSANGAEVQVVLREKDANEATSFSFNTVSSHVRHISAATGQALAQVEKFSVRDGYLYLASARLVKATEVLFQCHADGIDLVVVREEHNSFSNPLRWLAALSGHPVQISKIFITGVRDGKVVSQAQLARKAASYRWEAIIFK